MNFINENSYLIIKLLANAAIKKEEPMDRKLHDKDKNQYTYGF